MRECPAWAIHSLFAGSEAWGLPRTSLLAKYGLMNEAPHPLKDWIVANTTQAEFARVVGCSGAHLSDLLRRKKSASLRLAAKISRATGGAIPIDVFVKVEAAE